MPLKITGAEPQLGYLTHLYEVGPPVTKYAKQEADILAEIAAYVTAREEELKELHETAERRVRLLWGPGEIDNAKAHVELARWVEASLGLFGPEGK